MPTPRRLYLDQNYLSGIAKRKPAFRELELFTGRRADVLRLRDRLRGLCEAE